jgi:thiamine biosynthesis lipoprotein ApbE
MFDRVQKSVVYADFAPLADPFLANVTNNYLYYRQDTRYHFNPTVGNLLNLMWRALTGKQADPLS